VNTLADGGVASRGVAALAIAGFLTAGLLAQGTAPSGPSPASPQTTSSPPQQKTPSPDPATASDPDNDPMTLWTGGRYRVTPTDVLELRFPYVPEFDQTVTVQPDGYIALKAVGDLRVQGHSIPEVQALLAYAYRDVLQRPVIDVVLKEFEKPYFIVTGEVARPGKFDLRGATTLTLGNLKTAHAAWLTFVNYTGGKPVQDAQVIVLT